MNKTGSVLIVAVWTVSIFSVMASSLAFQAGQEVILMKRELRSFRGRADFSSTLTEVAQLIQSDSTPHEDSKDKPWFGEVKFKDLPGSRFLIHVEDEESKLNLNQASADLLSSFFKKFEDEVGPLKGERKKYVKAILKLRFESRINSLEELLLVEDFEKDDFQMLKPFITVYPEAHRININTASPLLLRALVESLNADHGSKQILANRLDEACRPSGCFFSSQDLLPENFAEKLKLPKIPLVLQVIQEFTVSLTLDSETFSVTMKSTDGAKASSVFRYRVGQVRPEVLGWHEDV